MNMDDIDPAGERFIELTERQFAILGEQAEGQEGTVLGALDDAIRRIGHYGTSEDIAWDLGNGPHPASMIGNSGQWACALCGGMGRAGRGDGDIVHTDACPWKRAHALFAAPHAPIRAAHPSASSGQAMSGPAPRAPRRREMPLHRAGAHVTTWRGSPDARRRAAYWLYRFSWDSPEQCEELQELAFLIADDARAALDAELRAIVEALAMREPLSAVTLPYGGDLVTCGCCGVFTHKTHLPLEHHARCLYVRALAARERLAEGEGQG